MMTERQRKFREQYKSNISPMYNGLLHIGVMYAAGIAAIWFCSAIRTSRCAAAGSILAIAAPLATTWPTFTSTAVTVPEAANCGDAVCELCSVPLELTPAVTSPRATAAVGRVVPAACESLRKKRR